MFFEQTTTSFDMAQVLVFKSNIHDRMEASALCTALKSVPGVEHCTIDLEDCDRVLRVQVDHLESNTLKKIVQDWGVRIEELAD